MSVYARAMRMTEEAAAIDTPVRAVSTLPGRRLNVLVIDEWVPYPLDCGKRVRTWNILSRVARHHGVVLLCYGERDSAEAKVLRSAGLELHTVSTPPKVEGWRLYAELLANGIDRRPYSVAKHYSRDFEHYLRFLLHKQEFDLLHCEWTPYAQYLGAAAGLPHLIMAHNIESHIWWRRAMHSRNWFESTFFSLQARKMERFEKAALRAADGVSVVTPLDLKQMGTWGLRNISLAENGVNPNEFTPASEPCRAGEVLCFGALDWYPNLDAVHYLLDEMWPLIRARFPNASLNVVGRGAIPSLRARVSSMPGVNIVGEVADVKPHLARASVVAVPLRIGGGSRIKILEALSMKKAVVTTSIGAEGLRVSDGIHLRIADRPGDFARAVVELLGSPSERQKLGENGRSLVEERYTWDQAAEALENAWLQLATRSACPPESNRVGRHTA